MVKGSLHRKERLSLWKVGADGTSHTTPQGSYFVLVDISGFLEKPEFTGWTDLEFCEWMIKNYGVAAVPGSSFFKEPVTITSVCIFPEGKRRLSSC